MVSIVLSYYKQPDALAWQLERLDPWGGQSLELVLVDDGSGDNNARALLGQSKLQSTLITIHDDVKWNIPEARNWGMVFAQEDLVFRSDIDHRPTEETLSAFLKQPAKRGEALTFRRQTETGMEIHRHTDTFLMSKADYWEVGGYDESLSGAYGSNAQDFINRASDSLVFTPSEMVIETNLQLASDSGSRSVKRNKKKLRWKNRQRRRELLHLKSAVSVSYFNR